MGTATLTTQELKAMVDNQCNLTDAHPRYTPVPSQEKILENLGKFFVEARERPYKEIEIAFRHAFYSLSSQKAAETMQNDPMLCYSASLCIQIAASYLRSTGLRVALLEPAFDNVTGILKAEKIDLTPLPEEQLDDIDKFLDQTPCGAIWLTMPNNPTGKFLSHDVFTHIIQVCKERKVILIIDFCFRFFCTELGQWDQYGELQKSGVTFITIEDTGKTWPTQDLKVGIIYSSNNIYQYLHYYYDNHLLNVSPVILLMLAELINDSIQHGPEATIYKIISQNRLLIEEATNDTILSVENTHAMMPVAWVKMNTTSLIATDFCAKALKNGLYILPGTNFFWHTPTKGNFFLRISLSREPSVIKDGMLRLRTTLSEIK